MASMKQVAEGLAILLKNDPHGLVSAEHDILYAGSKTERSPLSAEDKKAMGALGWHWCEEFESWARFT